MLGSIYAASTGGMFLIGYALKLGADNVKIGLLSSIPLCAVVFQLVAAFLIEKGVSRKKLTFAAQTVNVLCWFGVALTPWIFAGASNSFKLIFLIGSVTVITSAAHLGSNARSSWIGDLIPAKERGSFFGRITMFAGIIGTIFALAEGLFLDTVKNAGITTFSYLFFFGIAFGLANASLFLPQVDVPIEKTEKPVRFLNLLKGSVKNKGLIVVTVFAFVFSLQAIAGPFYPTYMLRDLKMSFLGVGLMNACVAVVMISSSSFWGRIIDKFGCKPVLVLCCLLNAPTFLGWWFATSATKVYAIIIPLNLFQGFWSAGISVGLSTLIYKVTPVNGRSVQLAFHSVLVVLLAAPMPAIGGYVPDLLSKLIPGADLRINFVMVSVFIFTAAFVASKIPEQGADSAKAVFKEVGMHFRRLLPRKL